MTRLLRFSIAATLSLLYLPPAFGQQESPETLRVASRLVNIDVLVTDKRTGARVDGLKKEDFEVLDDGRPQELTHFSQGADVNRPLALALVIDVGPIVKSVAPRLPTALQQVLLHLRPEDQVAVFDFGYWSHYAMVQELTQDRDQILKALETTVMHIDLYADDRKQYGIRHMPPDNMSAAILAAMHHVQERQPRSRMALVVISDDFNVTPDPIIDKAKRQLLTEGATVSGLIKVSRLIIKIFKPYLHAVDLASPTSNIQTERLAYYSAQTGGEIINVKDDDYSSALEQVIGNLIGRYSLGFVPDQKKLDGRIHKLTVKVKVPATLGKERNLTVRARRGYIVSPNVSPNALQNTSEDTPQSAPQSASQATGTKP